MKHYHLKRSLVPAPVLIVIVVSSICAHGGGCGPAEGPGDDGCGADDCICCGQTVCDGVAELEAALLDECSIDHGSPYELCRSLDLPDSVSESMVDDCWEALDELDCETFVDEGRPDECAFMDEWGADDL